MLRVEVLHENASNPHPARCHAVVAVKVAKPVRLRHRFVAGVRTTTEVRLTVLDTFDEPTSSHRWTLRKRHFNTLVSPTYLEHRVHSVRHLMNRLSVIVSSRTRGNATFPLG